MAISKKQWLKVAKTLMPHQRKVSSWNAELRSLSTLKTKPPSLLTPIGSASSNVLSRLKKGCSLLRKIWQRQFMLSNWYPDKPSIDPTCGSGTFYGLRRRWLRRNMAPGLRRTFFWRMELMDDRLIHEVRVKKQAEKSIARSNWYYGTDIGCIGWLRLRQRKCP